MFILGKNLKDTIESLKILKNFFFVNNILYIEFQNINKLIII